MTDRTKRALLLSPQPYFQWRGSPIRVGFNLQALVANGYEVDLVAMPVGEDRAMEGVRIFRAPNVLGVDNLSIGPSPAKAILDIFLFFKAWGLARRNRYTVIHGIEDAGIFAVALGRLYGTAVVFEKHSDPASYRKGLLRNLVMGLYGMVEKFTMRHADAVIGTGPGLVAQSRASAPDVPAFHIFDIPSSLVEPDPDGAAAVRARLVRDADEVLATYVGSFAVYQGIDLLFEAMPRAVRENPKLRFVIIGGSDEEIRQRTGYLQARSAADRVSMVGKVPPDALPNYLAASDILLSPRIAGNNTPLKLLDYLKASRPIVATDNEANRLILDEDLAILVPPSPEALARGVLALAGDPSLRERLGARGRRLIDERYNFEQFRQRLAGCYDRITGHS